MHRIQPTIDDKMEKNQRKFQVSLTTCSSILKPFLRLLQQQQHNTYKICIINIRYEIVIQRKNGYKRCTNRKYRFFNACQSKTN